MDLKLSRNYFFLNSPGMKCKTRKSRVETDVRLTNGFLNFKNLLLVSFMAECVSERYINARQDRILIKRQPSEIGSSQICHTGPWRCTSAQRHRRRDPERPEHPLGAGYLECCNIIYTRRVELQRLLLKSLPNESMCQLRLCVGRIQLDAKLWTFMIGWVIMIRWWWWWWWWWWRWWWRWWWWWWWW